MQAENRSCSAHFDFDPACEACRGQASADPFVPEWCEVRAKMRGKNSVLDLGAITVPAEWVENLAFAGVGFSVTFALPVGMVLEAGATVRIEVGQVKDQAGGGEPPFDPPYAMTAKRSD